MEATKVKKRGAKPNTRSIFCQARNDIYSVSGAVTRRRLRLNLDGDPRVPTRSNEDCVECRSALSWLSASKSSRKVIRPVPFLSSRKTSEEVFPRG